jgi:hypothetical protein
MWDSRLEDIIDISDSVVGEFIDQHEDHGQFSWLAATVREWKRQRVLPPGCKILSLDAYLPSPQHASVLIHFLDFVIEKVRTTLPESEAVLMTECERVKKFILHEGNGVAN